MGRKISKVIIENFQSHAYTEIDFGNFNGIIGPSDNGKTAIVRAMIWALYNNPSGDSYVKKGETKCQVTIVFDDGATIVKTRSPKVHSYDLHQPGQEPLHLEAFGVGPVDEVVAFHRMGFVDLLGEKQALNICKQLDSPFFLGESPATKAIIIGKLGNTEVIDKAIKNNASEMREVKAQEKIYKNQLKEVKQELKDLKNLEKMEKAIEFAKVKLDRIKTIESKNLNILDISSKLRVKLNQVSVLESSIVPEEDVNEVIGILDDLIKAEVKLSNIKELSRKIKIEEGRISELSSLCNVDLDAISDIISSLDKCSENIRTISSIKKITKKTIELESNLKKIKDLADKYEDAVEASKSLDEALRLSRIKLSILTVKEKLDKAIDRESKGIRIIANLDKSYEEHVLDYKNELKENKLCPICMTQLSDEKLEGIDKYI